METHPVNYDSPASINKTISRLGIKLKKRWGQNFLINRGARGKIVDLIEPAGMANVWEIGAGLGCLTEALLPLVGELVVFEIDRGLIRFLKESFSGFPNFSIIPGDVLKTWKIARSEKGVPNRVVGNLPYGSASALIVSFIENEFHPEKMVFMVQKELAKRMTASPGTKNYSSFSILCRYAYQIRECFGLKPGSFYPAPEVLSTVIELRPRSGAEPALNRKLFFSLVKTLFSSRRKTIRNNLSAGGMLDGFPKRLLLKALALEGIDPQTRSETLAPEAFIHLANRIQALSEDLQAF